MNTDSFEDSPAPACDEMTRSLMLRLGCSPAAAELCGMAVGAQELGDACLELDEGNLRELKGMPGIAEAGNGEVQSPFVLSDGRLYTRRNWQYEQNILRQVR